MRTQNGYILKQPIMKLFPIEYFKCQLDKKVGENANENEGECVGRMCAIM